MSTTTEPTTEGATAIAIRRAGPEDAETVMEMVREAARDSGVGRRLMATLAGSYAARERLTITWGMEPDNHGAQRFYRRLGASLRDKVLAGWSPAGYAWALTEAQSGRG